MHSFVFFPSITIAEALNFPSCFNVSWSVYSSAAAATVILIFFSVSSHLIKTVISNDKITPIWRR